MAANACPHRAAAADAAAAANSTMRHCEPFDGSLIIASLARCPAGAGPAASLYQGGRLSLGLTASSAAVPLCSGNCTSSCATGWPTSRPSPLPAPHASPSSSPRSPCSIAPAVLSATLWHLCAVCGKRRPARSAHLGTVLAPSSGSSPPGASAPGPSTLAAVYTA